MLVPIKAVNRLFIIKDNRIDRLKTTRNNWQGYKQVATNNKKNKL